MTLIRRWLAAIASDFAQPADTITITYTATTQDPSYTGTCERTLQ